MAVNAQIVGIARSIPSEPVIDARVVSVQASIPSEPAPAPSVVAAEITSLVPSIPAEPSVIAAEITNVETSIPEEPAEETFLQKLIGFISSSLESAAVLIAGLAPANINLVLEGLIKLPDGENLLDKLGMFGFDKLVKEMPELEPLRNSPKGSISVAIILGLITLIIGVGTVVGWLRKEAPEPSGLAVWAMIEAENWEAANEANKKYVAFINSMNGFIPTAISWFNPFLAGFIAINTKSQLAGAAAYQKIIDGHLAEIKGILKVTANVSGPDVYIDGTKKGIAPLEIELPSEYHHVLVTKFQYTNYEEDVLIKEGEVAEVAAIINPIAVPGPSMGTLKLIVEPNDAAVEIAGHPEINKMGNYELDPGTYTIKASKEGFYDKTATAIIKAGEVSNVSVILTEIPPPPGEEFGTLSIRIIPGDAVISVTDHPEINAAGDFQLSPGTYTIRAGAAGFYDKYATAYIKANEVFIVSLQLAEVPETPTPPVPGEVPTEEIIVPLDPYKKTYNAWKYTINAVAKDTGKVLHAAIFIDGAARGKYTPWSIYLYPEARYILRLEKWGYNPAEVEINTPAIPTE